MSWLTRFVDRAPTAPRGRPRLRRDLGNDTIYAIGDVHGCCDLLVAMERSIVADAAERVGRKLIVLLGDMIDRGPASAQVIDHLLAPPPEGFERVCLAGNHEVMMLEFLARPRLDSGWLANGGIETLQSYGIWPAQLEQTRSRSQLSMLLDASIPAQHLTFLARLPAMLIAEPYVLVHAGIRPGIPDDAQQESDLLWSRLVVVQEGPGRRVVHGHTPVTVARADGADINIDTGAFATGTLSAVRITSMGAEVLQVRHPR